MSARIQGLKKEFENAKRALTRAESAFKAGERGPDFFTLRQNRRDAEERVDTAWQRYFDAVDKSPNWTWGKSGKLVPVSKRR